MIWQINWCYRISFSLYLLLVVIIKVFFFLISFIVYLPLLSYNSLIYFFLSPSPQHFSIFLNLKCWKYFHLHCCTKQNKIQWNDEIKKKEKTNPLIVEVCNFQLNLYNFHIYIYTYVVQIPLYALKLMNYFSTEFHYL